MRQNTNSIGLSNMLATADYGEHRHDKSNGSSLLAWPITGIAKVRKSGMKGCVMSLSNHNLMSMEGFQVSRV